MKDTVFSFWANDGGREDAESYKVFLSVFAQHPMRALPVTVLRLAPDTLDVPEVEVEETAATLAGVRPTCSERTPTSFPAPLHGMKGVPSGS